MTVSQLKKYAWIPALVAACFGVMAYVNDSLKSHYEKEQNISTIPEIRRDVDSLKRSMFWQTKLVRRIDSIIKGRKR